MKKLWLLGHALLAMACATAATVLAGPGDRALRLAVERLVLEQTEVGARLARTVTGVERIPGDVPAAVGEALAAQPSLRAEFHRRVEAITERVLATREASAAHALTAEEGALVRGLAVELLELRQSSAGWAAFARPISENHYAATVTRFLAEGEVPAVVGSVASPAFRIPVTAAQIATREHATLARRLNDAAALLGGRETEAFVQRFQALPFADKRRALRRFQELLEVANANRRLSWRSQAAPEEFARRFPMLAETRADGSTVFISDPETICDRLNQHLYTTRGRLFRGLTGAERRELLEDASLQALGSWQNHRAGSILLDDVAGFRIAEIEPGLSWRNPGRTPRDRFGEEQIWATGDSHSTHHFQSVILTPYSDFDEIFRYLAPPAGSTVVDLGTAYARPAIVLGTRHEGVRFVGYELVPERVAEARRVIGELGIRDAEVLERNLADPAFVPDAADYYFIYDYGTPDSIRKTLRDLERIARSRRVTVVTRGGVTAGQITHEFPSFVRGGRLEVGGSNVDFFVSGGP